MPDRLASRIVFRILEVLDERGEPIEQITDEQIASAIEAVEQILQEDNIR